MKKRILIIMVLLVLFCSTVALGAVSVEGDVLIIDADGAIFSKDLLESWPERFVGEPRTGTSTLSNKVTQSVIGECKGVYKFGYVYGGHQSCSGYVVSAARSVGSTITYPSAGFGSYYSSDSAKIEAGIPWSFLYNGEHYGSWNKTSITGGTCDLSVRRYLAGNSVGVPTSLLSPTVVTVASVASQTVSGGCGRIREAVSSTSGNTDSVVCTGSVIGTFPAVGGKSVTYYGVTAAQMLSLSNLGYTDTS